MEIKAGEFQEGGSAAIKSREKCGCMSIELSSCVVSLEVTVLVS